MKLKTICCMAALFALLSGGAGELKVRDKVDVGSGAANDLDTWCEGGIGGHWLAVGQPNLCNRNDKVVFKFPLAQWIERGKIKKAVLRFRIKADKRNDRVEKMYLETFSVEKPYLNAMSLISPGAVQVGESFSLSAGEEKLLSFDVTAVINENLHDGFSYSTFRVSSKTAETEGAPSNGLVDSASIVKDSIVLAFEL